MRCPFIEKAYEPKNVQGTPYTSGGSMADGTYYYSITPLNAQGEGLRGQESGGITITGGLGAGRIALTWDAVAGAASYKVYRSTVQGQYVSPSYIANPTTNSYTDTVASPTAGSPPTFTSDNIKTPQMEEPIILADITIPGRKGTVTQYLGERSHGLRIEGILKGSNTLLDIGKLKTLRSHGIAVYVKIDAHSQAWIYDYYTIEKLEWALRAGRPLASGGEQVDWEMHLKQYVI